MDSTAKVVAWIGGAIFVVTYLVLLILQFAHIGAPDVGWNRRLELLNPLQSLAFAGAGALLGTAVQQQATNKALDIADQNKETADIGIELAGAVKATAAASGETPDEIEALLPVAKQIGSN